VVETYREKIEKLAYVDTFKHMLHRYEQLMLPVDELSFTTVETEQTPIRHPLVNGQRWQHLKDMDAEEEAYFNADENEDDDALSPSPTKPVVNGASPLKPLVDYPEDDDEDMELPGEETIKLNGEHAAEESPTVVQQTSRDETPPPPERITEKRRRTDDDEDELGKLSSKPKRRTSFGSNASNVSDTSNMSENTGPVLRRKRRLSLNREAAQKKIVISLPHKIDTASESRENEP
jgi:protein phosphatase 4 regulatory subunit 3